MRLNNQYRDIHQHLLTIVEALPTDFEPWGKRDRDTDPQCNDCSCGCKWFLALNIGGNDWGVCSNERSPRCGKLTFEHQGCPEFESQHQANMQPTPDHVTELKPNQIFVFGSNTEGRHGAGAAKQAVKFGAVYGKALGLQGQSYAILTKDLRKGLRSIPLRQIQAQVDILLVFAKQHPELEFLVTAIGVGLAGYTVAEIAPMFQDAIDHPEQYPNVRLPKAFLK